MKVKEPFLLWFSISQVFGHRSQIVLSTRHVHAYRTASADDRFLISVSQGQAYALTASSPNCYNQRLHNPSAWCL